jgi:hypothetical protein
VETADRILCLIRSQAQAALVEGAP